MDLKCQATCQGRSGGGLCESMTGAAQCKSVPETQTPVWTSIWATGAGQALWDVPWQPSWSPWQPPIPKDSYWLAGYDSSKCHRGQSEMPGLYHSSFREREKENVKDMFICLYINVSVCLRLLIFFLSLYTNRDCRRWPISVPLNRVYFEISMSFSIVLRAWSFWRAHTDILNYTTKLCMAVFYSLTNSQCHAHSQLSPEQKDNPTNQSQAFKTGHVHHTDVALWISVPRYTGTEKISYTFYFKRYTKWQCTTQSDA